MRYTHAADVARRSEQRFTGVQRRSGISQSNGCTHALERVHGTKHGVNRAARIRCALEYQQLGVHPIQQLTPFRKEERQHALRIHESWSPRIRGDAADSAEHALYGLDDAIRLERLDDEV